MPFILFFIYIHYLQATGYDITVLDWVCLFFVGLIQVCAWFVHAGIMAKPIEIKEDAGNPKRLDEWFKN